VVVVKTTAERLGHAHSARAAQDPSPRRDHGLYLQQWKHGQRHRRLVPAREDPPPPAAPSICSSPRSSSPRRSFLVSCSRRDRVIVAASWPAGSVNIVFSASSRGRGHTRRVRGYAIGARYGERSSRCHWCASGASRSRARSSVAPARAVYVFVGRFTPSSAP